MKKLAEFFINIILGIMMLCTCQVTENLIRTILRGFEQEITLARSFVTRLESDRQAITVQRFKLQAPGQDQMLETQEMEVSARLEIARKDLENKQQNRFFKFASEYTYGSALIIAITFFLFPILYITKQDSYIQTLQSQLDQLRNPTVNSEDDDDEDEEPEKVELPEVIPLPPEAQTSSGTSDGVTPNKS